MTARLERNADTTMIIMIAKRQPKDGERGDGAAIPLTDGSRLGSGKECFPASSAAMTVSPCSRFPSKNGTGFEDKCNAGGSGNWSLISRPMAREVASRGGVCFVEGRKKLFLKNVIIV